MTPSRPPPFVGRLAETAALQSAWHAARSGSPRIVVVTGEAGVGKSRLARRAREMMGPVPREVIAPCSPQHTGTAFHPLASALTEAWGLRTAGGSEDAVARVRAEAATIADPPTGTLSLLLALLGLPAAPHLDDPVLAPEAARRRTLEAIIGWLQAAAAQEPLLFVLEDLHWADASTLAFTAALVDALDAGHLLVVITARPPVAVPPMPTERIVPLALGPLEPDDISALVDALTGGTSLGAIARAQIIDRTHGVPLFVEELTRALVEPAAADEPSTRAATLRDLLMARLDRLGPAKTVAQAAATIGATFSLAMLDAVGPARGETLRAALDRLAAAALIEPDPTGGYRFRHVLIRDAAYESQTVQESRAVHARVAELLASDVPDVVATHPEVIAYHLDEAGRRADSAAYWCRAAVRERQRGSYAEAVGHLRRAETALRVVAPGPARDQLELEILVTLGISEAALRGFAAPEVGAIHRRARELCQRVQAGPLLFAALGGLWQFYYARDDFVMAHAMAEQHREAVRRGNELNRLCASYSALGYTSYQTGALAQAREQLEMAVDLYETYPRPEGTALNALDPGISAASCLVAVLCVLGDLDQASRRLRAALERAERLDPRAGGLTLSYVHAEAARAFTYRREPDAAVMHARRAIAIASELGYSAAGAVAQLELGAALAAQGDAAAAIEILGPGIPRWRAAGFEMYRPFLLAALAQAHARQGDLDTALQHVDEGLAHVAAFGERVYEAELNRQRGELLRARGETDAAAAAFTRALETARAQGARLFELRAAASLHRLSVAAGAGKETRALLAGLHQSFTEGLDTADLREVGALLEAEDRA